MLPTLVTEWDFVSRTTLLMVIRVAFLKTIAPTQVRAPTAGVSSAVTRRQVLSAESTIQTSFVMLGMFAMGQDYVYIK
jgi:hypothetical protein